MSELNQLLLDLNYKQNFNDHDFYVSKSNYFAFNIINKWPKWEKKILNICGEKFSGKTHLANIFKSKSKALLINHNNINKEKYVAKRTLVKSAGFVEKEERSKSKNLSSSFFFIISLSNSFFIN